FFFFQAEDGIRDYKVTGVQTCALPISGPTSRPASRTTAATKRSRPSTPRRPPTPRRGAASGSATSTWTRPATGGRWRAVAEDVSLEEVCVVACAEAWRGDGEILASPIGTIPMLGARLARA